MFEARADEDRFFVSRERRERKRRVCAPHAQREREAEAVSMLYLRVEAIRDVE
jgi:hypothetical protein